MGFRHLLMPLCFAALSACTMASEFIDLSGDALSFDGLPTHAALSNSLTQSPEIQWPDLSTDDVTTYTYAIGTEPGGDDVLSWTAVSISSPTTVSDLTLTSGQNYYVTLRAAATESEDSVTVSSAGWLVDAVAPTAPASVDDGTESLVLTTSDTITWPAATDALTSISRYEIALGSTPGALDIQGWTDVGAVTSYQFTSLSGLTGATTYYVSVRAIDAAGNISVATNSDGWIAGGFCSDKSGWATYNASGNAGTPVDPYLICTASQLANISGGAALSAAYRLRADIDLAPYYTANPGAEFKIGTFGGTGFSGVFDGNGYTIDNFTYVDATLAGVGLFGAAYDGAVIQDLTLTNVNVSGQRVAGGLIGESYKVSISNVQVSGDVQVDQYQVGGLIGYAAATKILRSTFEGDVTSTLSQAGGLVGLLIRSSIGESRYTGGTVEGGSFVGGLTGDSTESSIYSSSTSGTITSAGDTCGGLVGRLRVGSTSNSYSTANITCNDFVGGLVGLQEDFSILINSYATGNVSGGTQVGGAVGRLGTSSAELVNSYSVGAVTGSGGSAAVGYLVGESLGSVVNSYYLSTVNCDGDGNGTFGDCRVLGTARMVLSDFYGSSNAPMSSWDGVGSTADGTNDIWEFRTGDHAIAYFDNETTYTIPFTGDGTTTSPYLISTTSEFNSIGENPRWMGASFRLANNLDFSAITPVKIGGRQVPFTGAFDGNGNELSNIVITDPSENYTGVFGIVSYGGSGLTNLTLTNLDVTGANYTGGLAGFLSAATVNHVEVISGDVTGGGDYTGGLFGYATVSIITRTSSGADVTGGTYGTGGLGGWTESSALTLSFATGAVSGTNRVGGLLGHAMEVDLANTYATGAVTATGDEVGGLLGYAGNRQYYNSYATGAVSGVNQVGGAVGLLDGGFTTLFNFFATGVVNGTSATATVGPLIGEAINAPTLDNSHFYDNVGSPCVNSGAGSCNIDGIAKATLSEFYDPNLEPLMSWDFMTDWMSNQGTNTYPTLNW